MIQKEMAKSGIILYFENDKFILEKRLDPNKKKEFESYEEAIKFANNFFENKKWTAIIRYNRGLGIEYKNINKISAATAEEAREIATKEAEKILCDSNIIEIKINKYFERG